ncbi:MAG: hypothetical protein Q9219_003895 [cf. Caloplaca sp. 3 TL-2023]
MSNYLPTLDQAHICLRCLVRPTLTKAWSTRILRSQPTELEHRTFTAQTQKPQEDSLIQNTATGEQGSFHNSYSFAVGGAYEKDSIRLPNDVRKAPVPGYYFKSLVRYSSDALGITTLGKPAEVLRVQESPSRPVTSKWWLMQAEGEESLPSTEPLTSMDIMERVISNRGFVNPAKARENIEELRQEWLSSLKEPHLPPRQSDCYELGVRMHEGFTIKQLLSYINEFVISESTGLTDLNKSFTSALLTRSAWRAGITVFPGNAAQRLHSIAENMGNRRRVSLQTVISESALVYESRHSKDPPKYHLINKIMRRCWNIKPREELESVGEVDIEIPETHLRLISDHERDILRQTTNEYDVQINFSKLEPILRITASQGTCISTLKLLSLVLDEVACHEMPLENSRVLGGALMNYRTLFNDGLLREIERLSSTMIRWAQPVRAANANSDTLLFYYLRSSKKSLEDAQRFLEQSLRPTYGKATGVFYGGTHPTAPTLTSVPVETGQSLPLTERGVAWARRISFHRGKTNLGQNTEKRPEDYLPSGALTAVSRHIESSTAWRKLEKVGFNHVSWQSPLFQESSVALGRLLYAATDAPSNRPTQVSSKELNSHRVFTTELPGIRGSLESREVKILKVEEELYVRMRATGQVDGEALEIGDLPPLELRFEIRNREQKHDLKSVRLILEEKQADLLLPHEQVDLRFTTQTYIKAQAKADPRILSFIESSDLERWSDNDFDIPQILHIGIPRRLLNLGSQPPAVGNSEASVDYSVAQIERRSISAGRPAQPPGRRQFDLSFSSIYGGPIQGRRQEFRFFDSRALEFVPEATTRKAGEEAQKRSLVDGLYMCAQDIIARLRVEARQKVKPESKKSQKREKKIIMGFKGAKGGREEVLRRRSTVVRRRFTDSPIEPGEQRGRRPIRRVRSTFKGRDEQE